VGSNCTLFGLSFVLTRVLLCFLCSFLIRKLKAQARAQAWAEGQAQAVADSVASKGNVGVGTPAAVVTRDPTNLSSMDIIRERTVLCSVPWILPLNPK
jgi:hypothetical protein